MQKGHISINMLKPCCGPLFVKCEYVRKDKCLVTAEIRETALAMHTLGGVRTEMPNCSWHFGHFQCLCQWALG